MNTRESAEKALRTFSFSGQARQISVPIATATQGMMLGFQPFGVVSCSLEDGRDLLVVSAYYESAVCLAKVRVIGEYLDFDVEWVRGAKNTVRLFPNLDPVVGGNRCYVAYIDNDGNIVVGRGERKLYVLERSAEGWEYNGKMIQLPDHDSGEYFYVVYANEVEPGVIETNEHDARARWQMRRYGLRKTGLWEVITDIDLPQFCHRCAPREDILSVFDRRVISRSGISGKTFEVSGTGVAPLSSGGHVVVDYGQYEPSSPFNGAPGSLTYIPPAS